VLGGKKDLASHLKRWLTGLTALPILIYLIGFGPRWLFYGVVLAAAVIGTSEFYRMTAPQMPRVLYWAGAALMLALFAILSLRRVHLLPIVIFLWAMVPLVYFVVAYESPSASATSDMGKAVLGLVYVGLPLALLVLMDFFVKGRLWIFFVLTVVFATDTGAFYGGKLFGMRKLAPVVSPNKTWEGAAGGALLSLIAGLLFMKIFGLRRVGAGVVFLILCLSTVAQLGDLAESMLKRHHGIKDSGTILPGHGGILDRIDGLLFSTPVLYTYLYVSTV
jgi:phosphatidate cytidylyltransferase